MCGQYETCGHLLVDVIIALDVKNLFQTVIIVLNCLVIKTMIFLPLYKEKNKYYNDKIKFVVNSNWMNKMASKSSLLKNFEILTFFPSFDLNNFYEENDQKFYNSLNINPKKKKLYYMELKILKLNIKDLNIFIECLDHLEEIFKFEIIFFGNFDEKVLKRKEYRIS